MRYINLFAIDEDDQFEIAAIHELSYTGGDVEEKIEKAMQAVTKLRQQQKEGSGYFTAKYFTANYFYSKLCLFIAIILSCSKYFFI